MTLDRSHRLLARIWADLTCLLGWSGIVIRRTAPVSHAVLFASAAVALWAAWSGHGSVSLRIGALPLLLFTAFLVGLRGAQGEAGGLQWIYPLVGAVGLVAVSFLI